MSVKEIDNLKTVIRKGLCNRCGTCVGLSAGTIQFLDRTGMYLPQVIKEPDDDLSKKILDTCPGKGFDFQHYRDTIFPSDNNFHPYIGSYKWIYTGYSQDEEIRNVAASGGIISAILIWLLDKKMIDGAVVLGMSESEPWMNRPFIAKTRTEILSASQSKYTISSVNEILPQIKSFKGNLAYVGLPGQVQSVRKLQEAGDPSVKNIKYIFGPFYGNTLHFSSIISFLKSHGENDYHMIKNMQFRYGQWPGKLHIEMQNGRVIEMPKFHANYLIPFHIMKNSLLCTDFTNEFTDISGGDAWAPVYEERGRGFSIVLCRSVSGLRILENMVKDGALCLDKITENDAITMHSHGYDLKKRGTFIRMKFLRILGMEVPEYGYIIKNSSFRRYLMEMVIDILFLLAGTRLARWMTERISPEVMGRIFQKARSVWKNRTYKIKRSNL